MLTDFGIFAIILSFTSFFKKDFLLRYLIFFIPFTATSIYNSQNGSPILVSQYFLLISSIQYFVKLFLFEHAKIQEISIRYLLPMLLFLLVILLSLVSPFIVDGDFFVSNMMLSKEEYIPIKLDSNSFSRLIPLILGVLLVSLLLKEFKKVEQFLAVYIFSIIVISIIAIIEFYSFSVGYDVKKIFDYFVNVKHDYLADGLLSLSSIDFIKVKSVTLEPSILAQSILSIYPFCFFNIFNGNILMRKKRLYLFICVILSVALLISGSTTGYLGLLLTILFVVFRNIRGKYFYVSLFSFLLLIIFIYYLYLSNNFVTAYIDDILLNKVETFSYFERVYSISTSFEYFLKFPVLGLGWGSVTCHDLVVFLLVNSGIVGFIFFIYLIANLNNSRKLALRSVDDKRIEFHISSLFNNFIVFLLVMSVSEFTYYFLYFFFIYSITLATFKYYIKNKKITN